MIRRDNMDLSSQISLYRMYHDIWPLHICEPVSPYLDISKSRLKRRKKEPQKISSFYILCQINIDQQKVDRAASYVEPLQDWSQTSLVL